MIDRQTYDEFGVYYYPNREMAAILLLLAPLIAPLSMELNVIISSRVSDVCSASQLGSVIFPPFMGLYPAGKNGVITLGTTTLFVIAGEFVALVMVLFFLSTRSFQREEILTKRKWHPKSVD